MSKPIDQHYREYDDPKRLPDALSQPEARARVEKAVKRVNRATTRSGKGERDAKRIKFSVENGVPKLRFEAVAGFVSLGGLDAHIAPKVWPTPKGKPGSDDGSDTGAAVPDANDHWRALLDRMLEVGGGRAGQAIAVLPDALHAGLDERGLLEPIARYYADRLLHALDEQPLMAYQRLREDTPFLRGGLRLVKQLTRPPHQQHRLACEYSRLTKENPCVDLLRWANGMFYRLARLPSTRRRLAAAMERMGKSQRLPPPHVIARLRSPVGADPYKEPLEFARALYLSRERCGQRGSSKTTGVLIRMNDFFEAFVSGLYRRLAARRGDGFRATRQAVTPLAHSNWEGYRKDSGRHEVRPDDVLIQNDRVILTSDAKYKGRQPTTKDSKTYERIDAADLYQVISACVATNTPHGLVVRPAISQARLDHPIDIWTTDQPVVTDTDIQAKIKAALTNSDPQAKDEALRELQAIINHKITVGVVYLDLRNPGCDRWITAQVDQLETAFEQVLGLTN